MGGAISGIGGAVSGIIGGIGANKAAKQQAKSTDKQMDMYRELAEQQRQLLDPFVKAGTGALGDLTAIAGQPIDREAALKQYYGGQEFAQDSEAARRQQLAASAATGGLGSSATNNALAAIAPQLGQNYLTQMTAQQQDMYNQLMGLANVGLSGAGAQSAAAAQSTNSLAALQGQKGNINAARAALPWQVASNVNGSLTQGAATDANSFTNLFGGLFGGV
ncbi:DNA transfer protein [Kosakonia phage Kc166B]|nr:DNA transfer protein [Kosakonia phage Kc166B]